MLTQIVLWLCSCENKMMIMMLSNGRLFQHIGCNDLCTV